MPGIKKICFKHKLHWFIGASTCFKKDFQLACITIF